MNRLLIIFMTILFALSMTACGKKSENPHRYKVAEEEQADGNDGEEKVAKDAEESGDKDEAGSPDDSDVSDDGSEDGEAEGVLADVSVSRHTEFVNDSEYGTLYSNEYDELILSDSTAMAYQGLVTAVADYNDATGGEKNRNGGMSIDELVEQGKVQKKDNPDFSGYNDDGHATVLRLDDEVLSISRSYNSFYGGAHGVYGIEGYTYDVQSGVRLAITDVVADMDALQNAALEVLSRDYSTLLENESQTEQNLKDSFKEPEKLVWAMGPAEFVLYYNPYALATYAAGMQILNIRYDDHPEIFKEGYGAMTGDYVIQGSEARIDLDGDGALEYVTTENEYSDDGYEILAVKINTGIESKKVELYAYSIEQYIIKKGEHYYMYLVESSDNDYETIYMIDLTGGKVKELGKQDGGVASWDTTVSWKYEDGYFIEPQPQFYNPELLYINNNQKLISSFGGVKLCRVGDDGKIEDVDPTYRCVTELELTSKKDLTLKTVDASGNETGEMTVPKGTVYRPVTSDNKTYADCEIGDGTIVRVPVDSSDWPHKVDGDDLENVFDGVMFAGT